jgi:hypothetical protein
VRYVPSFEDGWRGGFVPSDPSGSPCRTRESLVRRP